MYDQWIPAILMLLGALPGLVGLMVGYRYWKERVALEPDVVNTWVQRGYLYLAVFVVAALAVSWGSDASPMLIAFGWIGAPVLAGVLGIRVFQDRQQLLGTVYPSLGRMSEMAEQRRQELTALVNGLSKDLNRAIAGREAMQQRFGAGARHRDAESLEGAIGRLRNLMRRCDEATARQSLYLNKLRALRRDEPALTPEERDERFADLRRTHRDLEDMLNHLVDGAVKVRDEINRLLRYAGT